MRYYISDGIMATDEGVPLSEALRAHEQHVAADEKCRRMRETAQGRPTTIIGDIVVREEYRMGLAALASIYILTTAETASLFSPRYEEFHPDDLALFAQAAAAYEADDEASK